MGMLIKSHSVVGAILVNSSIIITNKLFTAIAVCMIVFSQTAFSEDGFMALGNLTGGAFPLSRAYHVSDYGSVIAGFSVSANGIEAFRWTQTGSSGGFG